MDFSENEIKGILQTAFKCLLVRGSRETRKKFSLIRKIGGIYYITLESLIVTNDYNFEMILGPLKPLLLQALCGLEFHAKVQMLPSTSGM